METAARLFREKGTHLSVADLMKASGLTHGGFYKQFASKDALIDERPPTPSRNWLSCTLRDSKSMQGNVTPPEKL